jgi:hypothetical protein
MITAHRWRASAICRTDQMQPSDMLSGHTRAADGAEKPVPQVWFSYLMTKKS